MSERVEVSRSEVVVDGRTYVVERATEVRSVWVRRDDDGEDDGEKVELPLLDAESYTKITVQARWRGQWLTLTHHVDADHVYAHYQGDSALARTLGLDGDQYNGFRGTFAISELTDVDVERRPYDVPELLASTRRPHALDLALRAVGRRSEMVDWVPDEGSAAATARDGRWCIRATREGFVVGASSRGAFSTYDVFRTATPAIEVVARLVAEPLRRIDGTTPEQDEAGRRTGAAIEARRAADGRGPARLAVGDLLDCVGPESGHHLYALGTLFSARSQPPSDVGAGRYAFRLARPFPDGVSEGIAVPWFGQQGGGAMVVLDRPIRWYVDQGYLEPVGQPLEKELSDFHDTLDLLPGWQGVSYRGLPPGPLLPVGTLIRTTTLTATSRSPRVATENFAVGGLWAINGRSGRALEGSYDVGESYDVVFRPGSFLRVVKVARVGELPVVMLEDEAFWEPSEPAHASLDDFSAEVATRVIAERRRIDVPVPVPGKFVGPIYGAVTGA